MASHDLDIPFERVTYRDGQRWTARDMRADWQRDARLRRLHTRTLHGTWGIALGFDVCEADNAGAVLVGPGYAVDSAGQGILLSRSVSIPLPGVVGPATYVLVLTYMGDGAFRDRAGLAGLCLGEGLNPHHERPRFLWRVPDELHLGPQVPLAQVTVKNGRIHQGGLDFRVRCHARRLVRPHVAWGLTEPGRTDWKLWEEEGQRRPLGYETIVDTSEGGFTTTPSYFAYLDTGLSDQTTSLTTAATTIVVTSPEDSHYFVADANRAWFLFRVLLYGIEFSPSEAIKRLDSVRRRWSVSWLGVQPMTGCELVPEMRQIVRGVSPSQSTRSTSTCRG